MKHCLDQFRLAFICIFFLNSFLFSILLRANEIETIKKNENMKTKYKEIHYMCNSEFEASFRLIITVLTLNKLNMVIQSQDFYPGVGTSMRLPAVLKAENPGASEVIFVAQDSKYIYYLPFPKSELAKPTLNYFNSIFLVKIFGTPQERALQLLCAQY